MPIARSVAHEILLRNAPTKCFLRDAIYHGTSEAHIVAIFFDDLGLEQILGTVMLD